MNFQRVSCLNTESAANWDRKNDLPFGGDFGAHGKMILPYSALVLNYFALLPGQVAASRAEKVNVMNLQVFQSVADLTAPSTAIKNLPV
jgi:hypothetical protein